MNIADTKEYKELVKFIESSEFQKVIVQMAFYEILNEALHPNPYASTGQGVK